MSINTLYISDLDGTLLDENAKLSEKSTMLLNQAINNGADFTVATARTFSSVKHILSQIDLKYPLILMNGVLIYDPIKCEYIFTANLDKFIVKIALKTLRKHDIDPFIYVINNDKMHTYYEKISNKDMREFYEGRRKRYYKSFSQLQSFSEIENLNIIYFTIINSYDILKPVFDEISTLSGVEVAFYKDNYSADLWYMEIFSDKASKKKAVQFLRQLLNPAKITCFGDNLNDIPMFESADYSVAVGNAREELIQIADEVIGDNLGNSVAEYINAIFQQERDDM